MIGSAAYMGNANAKVVYRDGRQVPICLPDNAEQRHIFAVSLLLSEGDAVIRESHSYTTSPEII